MKEVLAAGPSCAYFLGSLGCLCAVSWSPRTLRLKPVSAGQVCRVSSERPKHQLRSEMKDDRKAEVLLFSDDDDKYRTSCYKFLIIKT